VVRRGLKIDPPAPWLSVVLDSEGLWAVARNDSEDARAVLASSREAGVPVLVPAVVLAETPFGDNRDARASQVLKKLQVIPISESTARIAAELKRLTDTRGMTATVDALVVATSAAAGGGVVLTADADDIGRLASAVSDVRIRPIRL
jgi:predicted nucleic acid-binding protein